MQEISDLERRLTAALERIARAANKEPSGIATERESRLAAEAEELRAALTDEQRATAELRLKLQDWEASAREERQLHDNEVSALKAIHATQSRDLVILAERLKADLAELQAERQAESDEVARILAAIAPLVEEAQDA